MKLFIALLAGAAIGCVGGYQIAKKKYEIIAEEEIESVKEAYRKKNKEEKKEKEEVKEKDNEEVDEDIREYDNMLKSYGYKSKEDPVRKERNSYPISPDEFGEYEGYEKVSLYYYSDGVLADVDDNIVSDIEETVGSDFEDHIGEYENNCAYIRNDIKRCDYEIILDHKSFSSSLRKH